VKEQDVDENGLSGLRTASVARQMTSRLPSEARSLFPPSLYEAEFVKTPLRKFFSFYFDSFWPPSGNNSPFRLWCLIAAMRGHEHREEPKSVTLSSA